MVKVSNLQEELTNHSSSEEGMKELIQLALLGSLTKQVLHETNNHLTGILGYISLAQKNSRLTESIASFLKRTIQCCESSQFISNTFLEFYCEEESHSDFSSVTKKVTSFCKKILGIHYAIQVSISNELSEQTVPCRQLGLLLLNLLLTAKNDIPSGGKIRLKATAERPDDRSETQIILTVTAQKAVESQTRQDYQGSYSPLNIDKDLCLYLIQDIVAQCGGAFVCANHSVRPSKYKITIPMRETKDLRAPTQENQNKTQGNSNSPLRIVLLEDQPVISDFIDVMFGSEGHAVFGYANGTDLAKALQSMNLSSVDLFLLDICVPGINGMEVGRLIRQKDPNAKIVFYSAIRNEKSVLEHFPLDEKTKFLQKPFKKEELIDLVQSVTAIKE